MCLVSDVCDAAMSRDTPCEDEPFDFKLLTNDQIYQKLVNCNLTHIQPPSVPGNLYIRTTHMHITSFSCNILPEYCYLVEFYLIQEDSLMSSR